MIKNEGGDMTFTKQEWAMLKKGFRLLNEFATSGPWTVTDGWNKSECIAYHKAQALVDGRAYDPYYYGDKE